MLNHVSLSASSARAHPFHQGKPISPGAATLIFNWAGRVMTMTSHVWRDYSAQRYLYRQETRIEIAVLNVSSSKGVASSFSLGDPDLLVTGSRDASGAHQCLCWREKIC